MRGITLWVAMTLAACQNSHGGSSSSTTPSTAEVTSGGAQAPTQGTVGDARPLTRGAPSALTLGCRAQMYVGPFRLARSGESVRIASTARSLNGAQACGAQVSWVDAQDQFVSVAGIGCPEGDGTTPAESVYEYSPDNGGNGANPVYLRIARQDPEGCAPIGLTLSLR